MNEVLYKNRYLIMCFIFAFAGYIKTTDLFFMLIYIGLMIYSGTTIANRMDEYDEKIRKNK